MKKTIILLITGIFLFGCCPMENPRVPLYEVSLGTDRMSVDFGSSHTLQAIITPKRTTDRVDLEWSSDDPSVVSINEEGVLTAVNHGEASVTVNASLWGKTVTCTFIVEVVPAVVIIPDEAFRNYCLELADLNDDGVLTSDETVTILDMSPIELGIKSLDGIRYFTSLEDLACNNNQLTRLDLTWNVALNEVYCEYNHLTQVQLGQKAQLATFSCHNNALTTLNVSGCPALKNLYCYINQLESLNLTQNPALSALSCYENQLSSLDLSQNVVLGLLACSSNNLTALDVTKNIYLSILVCTNNQIGPVFDISQNQHLSFLLCDNNPLMNELWLKTGQSLLVLVKDDHTVIKYLD
ncbi:MAG TPA: Ig-like domain-containing protein [Bacteroidales bacterium]|nr:Ig-like domain-containing protein [Bacteroidales bacterium]